MATRTIAELVYFQLQIYYLSFNSISLIDYFITQIRNFSTVYQNYVT